MSCWQGTTLDMWAGDRILLALRVVLIVGEYTAGEFIPTSCFLSQSPAVRLKRLKSWVSHDVYQAFYSMMGSSLGPGLAADSSYIRPVCRLWHLDFLVLALITC